MSSFLNAGSTAALEEELRRLMQENRRLREQNAELQGKLLAAQSAMATAATAGGSSSSSNGNGRPSARRTRADDAAHEDGGTGSRHEPATPTARLNSAEAQQQAKKAIEQAQKIAEVEGQLHRLRTQFEEVVNEVCERERAYQAVFADARTELAERTQLCSSLQQQVQDMRQHAAARAAAAPSAPAAPPLATHSRRRAAAPAASSSHEEAPPSRRRRTEGAAAAHSERADSLDKAVAAAAPLPSPELFPPQEPTLRIAAGAGALRDESAAAAAAAAAAAVGRRGRGRPSAAVVGAKPPAESSSATAQRRRGRQRLGDGIASTGSSVGSEVSSLFAALGAAPRPAAATPALRFGDDPVEQYLSLVAHTPRQAQRELLAQKLLEHAGGSVARVAGLVVERRRRQRGDAAAPPLGELWREVDWVLSVHTGVYDALCAAIGAALVSEMREAGADAQNSLADVARAQSLAALRTWASLLRLTHLHQSRRGAAVNRRALVETFVELTAVTLQASRAAGDGDAAGQLRVLEAFGAAATAFWGGGPEWKGLLLYYNTRDASAPLDWAPPPIAKSSAADAAAAATSTWTATEMEPAPASLALFTAQGVLSLCLVTSAAAAEAWRRLSAAVGWGDRQLPVAAIGAAAIARVRADPSCADALLALRLMTLQNGVSYLQVVLEGLRSGGGGAGASDAVFATLLSLAAVDLQLHDARDEQWQRALAFLRDYVRASAETEYNSAEEYVCTAADSHVLAVRAILELTSDCAASPAARAGVEAAMRWVATQRAALAVVRRRGSAPATHPLTDTALGRRVLALLPPLEGDDGSAVTRVRHRAAAERPQGTLSRALAS